jgi:questin oxidase-like protein
MTDAYDGVLEQFSKKGPEFGPGLSNHGPMASDALVAMGRSDALEPWAEWYAKARALRDPPESRHAIAPTDWREALGDIARAGDWSAFFHREVELRPWAETLETWAARLAPGIMAGATHGILRTAHAVRGLSRGETPQRLGELAEGLAYWAARYQELPAAPASTTGGVPVASALERVRLVDDASRGRFLIFDAVKAIPAEEFAPAINYVDVSGEVDAFVRDVTRTFVRLYLANAAWASIAFVHTMTAPSALRLLAPHLSTATTRDTMRYAWQACAAIYAAYARADSAAPAIAEGEVFDAEDLIDRAVAARDEHAIKFTEACLREHRISGDAAFIAAAEDAVVRLRAG